MLYGCAFDGRVEVRARSPDFLLWNRRAKMCGLGAPTPVFTRVFAGSRLIGIPLMPIEASLFLFLSAEVSVEWRPRLTPWSFPWLPKGSVDTDSWFCMTNF